LKEHRDSFLDPYHY